ncbi:hypothetical protein [Paracoccus beibuensis]|uniref:hypothetical protein n=1 Tax=Paracoccus beibuensis TaxID=547602 RepID=UPI00223F0BA6|nr:hypothetical protein [Paracoccus beibuensis]
MSDGQAMWAFIIGFGFLAGIPAAGVSNATSAPIVREELTGGLTTQERYKQTVLCRFEHFERTGEILPWPQC